MCSKCHNEVLWKELQTLKRRNIDHVKRGWTTEADASSSSSSESSDSQEDEGSDYVPSEEEVCLFSVLVSFSVALSDFKLSYECIQSKTIANFTLCINR